MTTSRIFFTHIPQELLAKKARQLFLFGEMGLMALLFCAISLPAPQLQIAGPIVICFWIAITTLSAKSWATLRKVDINPRKIEMDPSGLYYQGTKIAALTEIEEIRYDKGLILQIEKKKNIFFPYFPERICREIKSLLEEYREV